MADDQRPGLVIPSSVTPDRASSRLLRRGLDALEAERTVPLKVVDLIAFEDSIFVLSDDWDESKLVDAGKTRVGDHRLVVLYEFDHSGVFNGRLELPLIGFPTDASSTLRARQPSTLVVRKGFIYFWEELEFEFSEMRVAVHYLFSQSGELLAVWSDERVLDGYIELLDSPISVIKNFRSNWMTSEYLLSMVPRGRPLYTGDLYIGGGDTPHHLVKMWPLDKLTTGQTRKSVSSRHEDATDMRTDETVETAEVLQFPFRTEVYHGGSSWVPGWVCAVADSRAVWFLTGDAPWGNSPMVSRLTFHGSRHHIESYPAPTHGDLLQAGVLEGGDDYHQSRIKYEYIKAWDDLAILGMSPPRSEDNDDKSLLVVCQFTGEGISIAGELSKAVERAGILSSVGMDRMMFMEDRETYDNRSLGFCNGYLYGFVDSATTTDSVILINAIDGKVSRFVPHVPASVVR